jgi:hypothetical protein
MESKMPVEAKWSYNSSDCSRSDMNMVFIADMKYWGTFKIGQPCLITQRPELTDGRLAAVRAICYDTYAIRDDIELREAVIAMAAALGISLEGK